jgi:methylthioribulose-1-phosphate dehydratase
MTTDVDVRNLIVELSRQFFAQGWCPGTGGGIAIRHQDRFFVAPGGVPKERLTAEQVFAVDAEGEVWERQDDTLVPSASLPLFLLAFQKRDAGAVIHTHGEEAVIASLFYETEFHVTHLEMIKGIAGGRFDADLHVPIIENAPEEADLARRFEEALNSYPQAQAVLIRRHGLYTWGRDWEQAKLHAECYAYLFRVANRMRALHMDPARPTHF